MVWPITSVIGDTGRPTSVNSISAERPKASAGSTSGDMNSESSTFAVKAFERAMPSAVARPTRIARPVVHNAILSELSAAKCNCHASIRAAYQRNEEPGGGNLSEKPLVNDTMMTITVGEIRITTHTAASSTITAWNEI